jgi:hypothetical protein
MKSISRSRERGKHRQKIEQNSINRERNHPLGKG